MRYTQPVKRRNRTVLNQRPTAGLRLEQARTLLMIAVGAASSAGCHAPDPVASAPTEASAASVSSPVVTVLLENALFRPTRLNEDELRYINHEIQALDAAAQLPGLTSDSPDEVRVWQTSATFSASPGYATVGYVVTASGVSRCNIDYPSDGKPPFSARCQRIRDTPPELDADLLSTLLHYNHTQTSCGWVDGQWYTLDIVHEGQRAIISANNPDICINQSSMEVTALLKLVMGIQ